MRGGNAWMWSLIAIPMAFLWARSIIDMGDLHHGHTLGVSYFFVRAGKTTRELYRPEIYARERLARPYEATQFGQHTW